jgi:GTP-binding protein HflX
MKRRAILITYPENSIINEALGLAEAAGYEVVGLATQRFLKRAKYGVGEGKAQEVKRLVIEKKADCIVFDEKLGSSQIYNLTKLTGVEVIDRERLILQIFNIRANTAEAKLQVKLAELKYELPRAREKVRLAKQGEQPGFYGLGEYEVDVYYSDIQRRIISIARKLKEVRKRRELHRLHRRRLSIPTVSLAGYTGVGKTTLFNTLTGESKEIDKGAFTTLATTTRAIYIDGSKVLISDTVGFISRLPRYMLDAFHATLEELTYADLILLILDASETTSTLIRKYRDCIRILTELNVLPSKVVLVFNKIDLISRQEALGKAIAINAFESECFLISAKEGIGLNKLKKGIAERVLREEELTLAVEGINLERISQSIDWAKQVAMVRFEKDEESKLIKARIKGPAWVVEKVSASIKRDHEF